METRPVVIAHRGDSAHAPENTMRAFELAATRGADWIETDLQLLVDGEIVAFHDDDLRRLTGRGGMLANLSYPQLENPRIEIPRLSEILETVGQRVPFYLELKSDGSGRASPRHARLLARCLRAVGSDSHHALASFDLDLVRGALEAGRRAIYIVGRRSALDPCTDEELCELQAVSVAHDLIDAALVARLDGIGARLWAWTVDDETEIARMLDLGVTGICTNDVARARRFLQERLG